MKKDIFFMSYKWKIIGWILILLGTISATFLIFFDFRFTLPVFAVFSQYMETKIMATFKTNFADELTMLPLLSGFLLVTFSKEKTKNRFSLDDKARAIFKALLYNTLILIFSILFIYGQGFLTMLIVNLYSLFILYQVFLLIPNRH